MVAISALLRRLQIGSAPFATSLIRLAGPPTQTTGLVRQIPSQSQIPIESTHGYNLSVCLDQQAGERLVTHYRAADAKRVDGAKGRIQLTIAVNPHQASDNWRVLVDKAAYHDLPIRL